jgi:hypothetical protein
VNRVAQALALGCVVLLASACDKTSETTPATSEGAAPADDGAVAEAPADDGEDAPANSGGFVKPEEQDDAGSAGQDAEAPAPEYDGPKPGEVIVGDVDCKTDADCVPQECCHSTTCGAPKSAKTCAGAVCTMECRAGTLDCGGACLCQEGKCAARIGGPPA